MSKTVWFTSTLESALEVTDDEIAQYRKDFDAEDWDEDEVVREIAYDKFTYPRICAQCTGWGQQHSMDQNDWELSDDIE